MVRIALAYRVCLFGGSGLVSGVTGDVFRLGALTFDACQWAALIGAVCRCGES